MQDTGHIVRVLVIMARVLPTWMLSLGQRLPFRFHLPIQLLSTGWFSYLNWQQCKFCSPALQVLLSPIKHNKRSLFQPMGSW